MFDQSNSLWRWLTGRPPPTGDERRVWVRFRGEGNAILRGAGTDAAPIEASVRDLSRGGIGLVVDGGFHGEKLLLVDLPPRDNHPGGTFLAYVLRADPLPGGRWAIGCAFAAIPAEGGLAAFIGPGPADGDRRAWARLPSHGSCRYYPIGGYDLTRRAEIINASPAGVGLIADQRVEPSVILSLDLERAGGNPLSAIATVISASPLDDNRWLLGCCFQTEMEEAVFCRWWHGGDSAPH